MRLHHGLLHYGTLGLLVILMTACTSQNIRQEEAPKTVKERRAARDGKLFGDGMTLWGGEKHREGGADGGGGSGVSVNAYLWYAALDVISFMPISSADPFGGTIITDWYTSPTQPQERMKVNIFILDRLLRSDAIKVTAFHEKWDTKTNQWAAIPADPKVSTELENLILTRARQLRIRGAS